MEFLTIFLSGLLGLFSPVGLGVEQIAARTIRDQFDQVETLAVRIDNAPNYRVLQGNVERVRIAGRGLYPEAGVRIAALEVETEQIQVDPAQLRQGQFVLKKPLYGGVRLVLTREDINQALRSPQIVEQLRDLSLNFLGDSAAALERYELVEPQVEFLDGNRLRLQAVLRSQPTRSGAAQTANVQLTIAIETGLEVINGRQLQLLDPSVSLDGRPLPSPLVQLLVGGISQRLDLANLEPDGIKARVLTWQLDRDQISLAALVRIDPKFTAIDPAASLEIDPANR
ncbi:MAG: DUF2993 domain-containing protein [Elainella sp.]